MSRLTKNAAVAADVPTLSQFSPAKLNLFLHITGKREDGYHNLQTVFRLLDWGDTLHFWRQDNQQISLVSADAADAIAETAMTTPVKVDVVASHLVELMDADSITQNPADNLIIKAAQALLDYLAQASLNANASLLPQTLPQITVKVDKIIPMGAGLGGGSSNAATTLLVLNKLWQLNLAQPILLEIAAKIGADVPIFIFNQDAIAEGIGEQLTPIKLPKQRYLMLLPQAHVNTAKLFAHPDLRRDCPTLPLTQIAADSLDYLWVLTPPYHNVFEPVVCQLAAPVKGALTYLQSLASELSEAKLSEPNSITGQQNIKARMTGSGSTVFLPLPQLISIDLALWMKEAPCSAVVVDSLFGE
jgi:4-diphosphocytidyl-2-C-methyl-D-erythritol kinase